MTLGERLVRLRAQAGLSQDALAERLEVSRQSVSKWENNISVPDLEKLIRLSEIYHVSLDELVKGDRSAAGPDVRGLRQKASQLYHEKGYLLGWILSLWGAWGLLRSIWNCLITLPVLGTWEILQLFFIGLLPVHLQNFMKILFGALLVLYGRRRAGHLRWCSLAWGLVAIGIFGIPHIPAVQTGLLPFLIAVLQAGPQMTGSAEWGEFLTALLRQSGGCPLLFAAGLMILLRGRRRLRAE